MAEGGGSLGQGEQGSNAGPVVYKAIHRFT